MNALTQTLTLPCGTVLPNRIAKSAMAEGLGDADGNPSAGHMALYERWAAGGTGLLITGNVMIDRRAQAEPSGVVVEDEGVLESLRRWATVCTQNGTHAWVQMNHPGRQVPASMTSEPVAPSAVAMKVKGGVFRTPRALTHAEIEDIIARFARTAALVQEAGFTGVQIHAAHGYLASQFLSPLTNLRTDAWGGDAERRRRFLVEVVRAVRAAVGPAFPVGVKLNSADFQRGGFSTEESMAVVEALEAEGIDLLEVSGGTYERSEMAKESLASASTTDSTRNREAFFLDYAEQVRARTKVPILLTGGLRSGGAMTAALDSGAVDLVGLARPLAVEPDLPKRMLADPTTAALPIRLATGIRDLDGLIQGTWYGAQLGRMGRGLAPDPGLWRLAAVLGYLRRHLVHRWGAAGRARVSMARTAAIAAAPA
jgi:2,4-dienoyl-CoA reductase-like NADH-dependent reductase (Old Yellow Enzyme family)